jgi:predicted Zn-dependent peptidase
MMRVLVILGFAATLGFMALPAAAQSVAPMRTTPLEKFTLKNGLRVILAEDHSAPTFGLAVTYDVGSRDELPGHTGLAHFFEHMMFQGSENVGKGEHFLVILNNGGTMDGSTSPDRTNYMDSLPANQLDIALFLEADRMRSLAVTEANVENQKRTVQEERRLGTDNRAYGRTREVLVQTVFDNFAYQHSVGGSMADLDAASLADIKEFFRIYYAPNNAVLTLVGDFNPAVALAKIKTYFESIPAQPTPKRPDFTEPLQTAERRTTIEDVFAPTARLDIVFKLSPGNTPDYYAAVLLGRILASGRASRLYQTLIKGKQLAEEVRVDLREQRARSLLDIVIMAKSNADLSELEKAVDQEITRVQAQPVAQWELQKACLEERRERAEWLTSSFFKSMVLGEYAVFYNEPELVNTIDRKFGAVTAKDVQRVAREYLGATQRTVITTRPKSTPPRLSGGAR